MEIVLKYNDNDKEYVIYRKDGKYYGGIDNKGKVDYDLTEEEKDTMNYVLKELCFNSNSPKIATIEFESELLDIYYDKERDLYNFAFQSSRNFTKEQISTLNILLNNRDNVVHMKINELDFIKRFIKKGKKTILVLLSASIILQQGIIIDVQARYNNGSDKQIVDVKDEEVSASKSLLETVSFEMSDEEKREKVNNLKDAIKNNPYLTEEEMAEVLSCFSVVEDNIEYIDYEYVLDLYRNRLKIVYVNSYDGPYAGTFNPTTGEIELYNVSNISMCKKFVFTHEFNHTLEKAQKKRALSGFYESLNSIYNSEYFGIYEEADNYHLYDESFNFAKPYIYVLAEILRPETLRRYHFTQDYDSLIQEMMTILPDREKCQSIIYGIATLNQYNKKNDYLISQLKELYEAEYGEDISNNIEVFARLEKESLCEYIDIEDEYEVLNKKLVVKTQKAYFNKNNPYYMVPSTFTLIRSIQNAVQTMSIDEAISSGLVKYENGELIMMKDDAFIIDDNTIGYKIPYGSASVVNDIDINDYYKGQDFRKKS